MTAYTREELLLIAAAHATGAASSEEELALHSAMQNDPELLEDVVLNGSVLDAMTAAYAVAPSDLVRGRLLAQARGAAPLQLTSTDDQVAARPRRNIVAMVFAAASVVALLGMGAEIVRLRAQVNGANEFASTLQGELNSRDAMLNPVLNAENHLRVVHMLTGDTLSGPGIQVFWNRARGTAVLHAFRLPPAPGGRRYQLWALGDGSPRPLLAFNSEPGGHALISKLEIPIALQGIRSLAVTIEPIEGSAAPTTAAIVRGDVRGT